MKNTMTLTTSSIRENFQRSAFDRRWIGVVRRVSQERFEALVGRLLVRHELGQIYAIENFGAIKITGLPKPEGEPYEIEFRQVVGSVLSRKLDRLSRKLDRLT